MASSDALINKLELRSRALLHRHLSAEQWDSLIHEKYFCVRAESGRMYKLEDKFTYNVRHGVVRYCLYTSPALPKADVLLAQKLLLENDEQRFKKVANLGPDTAAAHLLAAIIFPLFIGSIICMGLHRIDLLPYPALVGLISGWVYYLGFAQRYP